MDLELRKSVYKAKRYYSILKTTISYIEDSFLLITFLNIYFIVSLFYIKFSIEFSAS